MSGEGRGAAFRLLGRVARRLPAGEVSPHPSDQPRGFVGLLAPDGVVLQTNCAGPGPDAVALRGSRLADTPWWSALPYARAQVQEAVARAAAGQPARLETEAGLANGAVLPVELSIVPLFDAQARVTHLVATTVEPGERRRTTGRPREFAPRLRAVLDGARIGLWECDVGSAALLFDRRASRVLGGAPARRWIALHDAAAADGKWVDWLAQVHPDDRPELESCLAAARTGERCAAEYRVRHPDGNWVRVAQRGAVVTADPATGRPRRIAGIVQDITAYRDAEPTTGQLLAERGAALRDSERRFERLVLGVKDFAIFMLDLQGRVTSWNEGARRIKGYPAGEIIGRSYTCFHTEEDRARGVPEQALATALREGHSETEGWRVRRDGSRFWASVVIDTIPDEAGRPAGFAKITRDLTLSRELQRQLVQAQKMEAIGQLTGGIAHDFNNLLQAVSGNLELAAAAAGQGNVLRAERLIANALRAIGRGARLTSQLLAFSRKQVLFAERSRVSDVASDMPDLLRRASGNAVRVVIDAEPELWTCRIDPGEFQSALLNLVLNARDAMPGGGTVTVSMHNIRLDGEAAAALELARGDYVRVAVADTGTGMAPEVLARAFEPFFTTKEVGKGSGLGLPQVLGFTKQSGGSLSVQSSAGQGTTVSLFFPRDADPGPEGRPAEG
jgi:PAS domain S-box-containing protein